MVGHSRSALARADFEKNTLYTPASKRHGSAQLITHDIYITFPTI